MPARSSNEYAAQAYQRALRIAGAVEALGRSTGIGVIGEGFEALSWRTPVAPTDEQGLRYWSEGQSWTIERLAEYAREGARSRVGSSD
jgi:hypothetical protein